MKKRILSILLTLCMAICLVPVSVLADDTALRSIAVQNIGHTEAAVENDLYEKMSLQVSVITLISDIELNGALRIDYAVTIDLNGHALKMSEIASDRVLKVEKGGHLTIIDSDPTAEHKFTPNADGLWVLDEAGGTEIVKGGIITGGNTGGDDGGGVYIEPGGRFTMNGGSIVGCQARSQYNGAGGGVKVECETDPDSGIISNGTFTMNGGAIIGCVARHGGGVEINGGGEGEYSTFTMNGGVIDSCVAADGMGGGVKNDGLFIMGKDAAIKNCKAVEDGRYYLGGGVSFTGDRQILNGEIVSGDANDKDYIFVNRGTVTIGANAKIQANIFCSNGTMVLADGVHSATVYGKITNGRFADGLVAVTYRVNGADYATQILRSGTTALKPDDPAKDGYAFIGWYNGDAPYDFTGSVTGDITLTAKWAKLCGKTADFTAPDGGAAAIALLNSAKNGAEDSVWDNVTKTLTLKGVSFATTAATAVKLPDGATVILAGGTANHIIGGDAAVSESGKHQNQIYVYGIYAAGALTVQGETNGTGKLYVNSGEHINSGNAWTYSTALYADGDLAVNGGAVTALGGKTSSADCAFSLGVQLSEGHSLSVSGGTLTGIGGESYDTEDPNDVWESFSEGIDIYRGNVTISGGKLLAETVPDMMNKGLSFGLRTVHGSLFVSDSAVLTAKASQAIVISGGDIKLSGGKICSYATSDNAAVSVTRDDYNGIGNANIEISGGEFTCVGGIYMSASTTAGGMGILSVTNGKLTAGSVYGPDKLIISNGTVISGRINADTVELQSGRLTVREPVYKNESTDVLYASHAIFCKELIVSGGTLDAAWDWGEYTPTVFPVDSYWGYAQPLIKVLNGTASFGGGTVILDTGCAGNTALKAETLDLSGGIRGSGYTNEDGSDTYIQSDGSAPVKFVVYSADYGKVDEAIKKANALNKDDYKDFSAVEAAVNAVVRGKNLDEQAAVNAMAKAIEDAVAALEYKGADYGKVEEAIAKANALNKDDYKDFSAVEAAINAVVRGKNITEQAAVDAMAKAIEDAVAALEYKEADYGKVEEAIKKANALNKNDYKDFSAVEAAINAVVRGKNITEQAAVDAMAKAIEDAIAALEIKSPQTGDNGNAVLWFALLFISGGVCAALAVKHKKSY